MLNQEVKQLAEELKQCQKVLIALGDVNRLHIIMEMLQVEDCNGIRVGEITAKTHLSRPAVSHHLQILKETDILSVRKEGTKNYYYFSSKITSIEKLIHALQTAIEITSQLPDRSRND